MLTLYFNIMLTASIKTVASFIILLLVALLSELVVLPLLVDIFIMRIG